MKDRLLKLSTFAFEKLVREALAEDLGRGFDLTTEAIVGEGQHCSAEIISRADGVVAGAEIAALAFRILDPEINVDILVLDGTDVRAGDVVLGIKGKARAVLTGERTALNFLGHLSGIASLTRQYVNRVKDTGAKIVCTRKTTPGLRVVEKFAVRCGGGSNHRFGLDDAVLIKENHIAIAGGIQQAVEHVRSVIGHAVVVEIEVESLQQLEQALEQDVDTVLLDNMPTEELRQAVVMVGHRALVEASGGVSLETVAEIAETGVDLISVGALTHSAPALDVSLLVSTGEVEQA